MKKSLIIMMVCAHATMMSMTTEKKISLYAQGLKKMYQALADHYKDKQQPQFKVVSEEYSDLLLCSPVPRDYPLCNIILSANITRNSIQQIRNMIKDDKKQECIPHCFLLPATDIGGKIVLLFTGYTEFSFCEMCVKKESMKKPDYSLFNTCLISDDQKNEELAGILLESPGFQVAASAFKLLYNNFNVLENIKWFKYHWQSKEFEDYAEYGVLSLYMADDIALILGISTGKSIYKDVMKKMVYTCMEYVFEKNPKATITYLAPEEELYSFKSLGFELQQAMLLCVEDKVYNKNNVSK